MIKLCVIVFLISCTYEPNTAQEIVDRSIEYHGGDKFNNATISFKFRDKHYYMRHSHGAFDYRRIFQDSIYNIMDQYTNSSFHRYINGKVANIPDSMAFKYKNSVNSVIYFASLPFRLRDEAAQLKRLDDVEINGKSYYKIYVTFSENNGGKDFEDVFCYWFRKENFALDYMAYEYTTDGGGSRFRIRTKTHHVNGLKLLDYDNYEPVDKGADITTFDILIKSDKLKKLSEINLEHIEYIESEEKTNP